MGTDRKATGDLAKCFPPGPKQSYLPITTGYRLLTSIQDQVGRSVDLQTKVHTFFIKIWHSKVPETFPCQGISVGFGSHKLSDTIGWPEKVLGGKVKIESASNESQMRIPNGMLLLLEVRGSSIPRINIKSYLFIVSYDVTARSPHGHIWSAVGLCDPR